MQTKQQIIITVTCRDIEEMAKARQAILYHLETLNPVFQVSHLTLTATVPLLDSCFEPQEATDIIRLTLAQSLTFTTEWKCALHTVN